MSGDGFKCKFRMGAFPGDSTACSNFVDEEKVQGDCSDCSYFEETPSLFSYKGKCMLTRKTVGCDTPACSRFVEA